MAGRGEPLGADSPLQAIWVARQVGDLVRLGRAVALGIAKGLGLRHRDEVEPRAVIRAVPAMADRGAGRGDEGFSRRDQYELVAGRLRLPQVTGGAVLNLRGIKHTVNLEEPDSTLALGPPLATFPADHSVRPD